MNFLFAKIFHLTSIAPCVCTLCELYDYCQQKYTCNQVYISPCRTMMKKKFDSLNEYSTQLNRLFLKPIGT